MTMRCEASLPSSGIILFTRCFSSHALKPQLVYPHIRTQSFITWGLWLDLFYSLFTIMLYACVQWVSQFVVVMLKNLKLRWKNKLALLVELISPIVIVLFWVSMLGTIPHCTTLHTPPHSPRRHITTSPHHITTSHHHITSPHHHITTSPHHRTSPHITAHHRTSPHITAHHHTSPHITTVIYLTYIYSYYAIVRRCNEHP
jgi:hypothetical protein